MSSAQDSIALTAAELEVWGSIYTDCPFCGRAGKMGITNSPDGVLYHCFSTHCGQSGRIGGRRVTASTNTPVVEERRYLGHTAEMGEEDWVYFQNRFGIIAQNREIRVTERGAYFLPIRTHKGQMVGEVIRQPTWSGEPRPPRDPDPRQPKARTYLASTALKLAWYLPHREPTELYHPADLVVLVEDQISAMKIRDVTGYTAVALLGSTLEPNAAQQIREVAINSCVLWLDPDMNAQAFKIAAEHGAIFNHFRVILSVQDPKDLTAEQIEEKLLD